MKTRDTCWSDLHDTCFASDGRVTLKSQNITEEPRVGVGRWRGRRHLLAFSEAVEIRQVKLMLHYNPGLFSGSRTALDVSSI